MLEQEFDKLYLKFRVNYYKNLFSRTNEGKSSFSTTEAYCLEVIYLLNRPTVSEFAEYINISLPNATYKINSLIQKGYIRKVLSEDDKREYHLEVTEKFMEYYNANTAYNAYLMKRFREKYSEEEVEILESMIKKLSDEFE